MLGNELGLLATVSAHGLFIWLELPDSMGGFRQMKFLHGGASTSVRRNKVEEEKSPFLA